MASDASAAPAAGSALGEQPMIPSMNLDTRSAAGAARIAKAASWLHVKPDKTDLEPEIRERRTGRMSPTLRIDQVSGRGNMRASIGSQTSRMNRDALSDTFEATIGVARTYEVKQARVRRIERRRHRGERQACGCHLTMPQMRATHSRWWRSIVMQPEGGRGGMGEYSWGLR